MGVSSMPDLTSCETTGGSLTAVIVILTCAELTAYRFPSDPFQSKDVVPFQFATGLKRMFFKSEKAISVPDIRGVPERVNVPLGGNVTIRIFDNGLLSTSV
jgi:hypothetical protein